MYTFHTICDTIAHIGGDEKPRIVAVLFNLIRPCQVAKELYAYIGVFGSVLQCKVCLHS